MSRFDDIEDLEKTALNTALANQKLWMDKCFKLTLQRDQKHAEVVLLKRELRSLDAEYSSTLLREQRLVQKLEQRLADLERALTNKQFVIEQIDPFLPASMQDAHLRAANEAVYKAVGELVKDL